MRELQRSAGNQALRQVLTALGGPESPRGGVPPVVRDALAAGDGQPLDADTRVLMESRFDRNLGDVRVHTGPRADESARLLGARAYTAGRHIAFRAGLYAPGTTVGQHLLAHELTHVLQARGAAGTASEIAEPGSRWEAGAEGAATAVAAARAPAVGEGAPAAIRLAPDPELADYLTRVAAAIKKETSIVGPVNDEEVVAAIFRELRGLNLTEVDNLGPVARVVQAKASSDVFVRFLRAVQTIPRQAQSRTNQVVQQLQVQRRGAWGVPGPGTPLFTAADVGGRPIAPYVLPVLEVGGNVYGFVEGLVSGLAEGLGAKLSEEDRKALRGKLMESAVIAAVLPALMGVAAAHGIARDAYQGVEGVIEVLKDPVAFAKTIGTLIETMISENGKDVGRAMGADLGAQHADEVKKAIAGSAVGFAYDFGKLVGPYIVNLVLAIAGITLGAALIAAAPRLFKVLSSLAEKSTTIAKLLERLKGLVKRKPHLPEPHKTPSAGHLPHSHKGPPAGHAPEPHKTPPTPHEPQRAPHGGKLPEEKTPGSPKLSGPRHAPDAPRLREPQPGAAVPGKQPARGPGKGKIPGTPDLPPHPGILLKKLKPVPRLYPVKWMREFLAKRWKETKYLQELAEILPMANDVKKKERLIKLLDSWARQTGLSWEKTAKGVITSRDPGLPPNLASHSWKPGTLLIEEQVFDDIPTLSREVLHELCASAAGFPHTARYLDTPRGVIQEYYHAGRLLERIVEKKGDFSEVDKIFRLASPDAGP